MLQIIFIIMKEMKTIRFRKFIKIQEQKSNCIGRARVKRLGASRQQRR